MKKITLYFFLAVGVGEIVSIGFDITFLQIICKPLIMIALGFFYWSSVNKENRSVSLNVAIMLSCAGDVFLLLQNLNQSYFILGLLAFLMAHVFYTLAYRQHKNDDSTNALRGVQRVRFAFPIILAGTGLVVVLYPVLGSLKLPVMIYSGILIIMVLNSLFRYGYTNAKSFWMVFAGAILFLVSDSVLAINKFLQPINQGIFIVMLTYIVAQFFIIQGLIYHTRKV